VATYVQLLPLQSHHHHHHHDFPTMTIDGSGQVVWQRLRCIPHPCRTNLQPTQASSGGHGLLPLPAPTVTLRRPMQAITGAITVPALVITYCPQPVGLDREGRGGGAATPQLPPSPTKHQDSRQPCCCKVSHVCP